MGRPNDPRLEPTKIPDAIEVAFAAGFYEGEGYVVQVNGFGTTIQVEIAQKEKEILMRFTEWFGGSVCFIKNSPYPHYRWRISGDKCNRFLDAVYPMLSDRRKSQIARVLESVETARLAHPREKRAVKI